MAKTILELLAGEDMEGGEGFGDCIYNFLKNQGKDINLLTNSGFGVWSQSDTNKGIGYLGFDSGSVAPVVGETLTDADSGAVGKVMYFTVSSGTWGGGNAAGTIYLGACSTLCFNNNADVNGSVGGANMLTVNQPDGAVGTDGIVENGAFVTDNDPPNNWSATGATLTTEAGGQVGNCMMVTDGGGANGTAHQQVTTVIGKIYKFSAYFKKGTSASGRIRVGTAYAGEQYYGVVPTDVAWTQYVFTFEATTTTTFITLFSVDAGDTSFFDEITLYDITPCCTEADTVAMDGWEKAATADVYREHLGSNTKDGSFYASKLVNTVAGNDMYFPLASRLVLAEWYELFQGRPVTLGMWVKTSTASHARLRISDGVTDTFSSYHTGGGSYEWLEITKQVSAANTNFHVVLKADAAPNVDGSTIIYASQPMLVFGWSLGEGMYQPRLQEIIWLEKNIPSNVYDNTIDWSDVAAADLNIEADSDAMLPKGAKLIAVHCSINDSGSGGGLDVHLQLRKDATSDFFYCNSVAGKTNDVHGHKSGVQPCDVNGDVDIHLDATGADTLDIDQFEYHGVQVT